MPCFFSWILHRLNAQYPSYLTHTHFTQGFCWLQGSGFLNGKEEIEDNSILGILQTSGL